VSDQPQDLYRAGRAAFERGNYRQAIALLEQAAEAAPLPTALGGDVRYWLAMALQAANRWDDAKAVCASLSRHPDATLRQQAADFLYILEAPVLQKDPDWQVTIPDLSNLSDDNLEVFRRAAGRSRPPEEEEKPDWRLTPPDDLDRINTRDNQFLWLAAGLAIALLLVGALR
jgi:tetratricopeptide (TPR) repeat protein